MVHIGCTVLREGSAGAVADRAGIRLHAVELAAVEPCFLAIAVETVVGGLAATTVDTQAAAVAAILAPLAVTVDPSEKEAVAGLKVPAAAVETVFVHREDTARDQVSDLSLASGTLAELGQAMGAETRSDQMVYLPLEVADAG